jgi:formylglycine-generating enzyme required for sulfatase activity
MFRFLVWFFFGCVTIGMLGCYKEVLVPVTMNIETVHECNIQFQIPSNWGTASTEISDHLQKISEKQGNYFCEAYAQNRPKKSYPLMLVTKHFDIEQHSSLEDYIYYNTALSEYDEHMSLEILEHTSDRAKIRITIDDGQTYMNMINLSGQDNLKSLYSTSILFIGNKGNIQKNMPLINSITDSAKLTLNYEASSIKTKDNWIDSYTGMEFVWVPGGCYQMGCGPWTSNCTDDEKPVHEVCLDGFWMGKYEVTQAQWEKVMGSNPSKFKGPNNPVEMVSWNDVQEYIRKLNSRSKALGLRLPTEAEWEYACRGGGKQEKYCGGNNADNVAWHTNNSGQTTHPVGQKLPNTLGIYDMSGNVWEWVSDAWTIFYENSYSHVHRRRWNPENTGGGNASERIIRGGGWSFGLVGIRAAARSLHSQAHGDNYLGFRLALSPGSVAAVVERTGKQE